MTRLTTEDEKLTLDRIFKMPVVTPEKQELCQMLRDTARAYADTIVTHCVPGRERSLALTSIEVAMLHIESAVLRNA